MYQPATPLYQHGSASPVRPQNSGLPKEIQIGNEIYVRKAVQKPDYSEYHPSVTSQSLQSKNDLQRYTHGDYHEVKLREFRDDEYEVYSSHIDPSDRNYAQILGTNQSSMSNIYN